MKIDYLLLKKICIAQTGVDPHFLIDNSISNYTKKKLQNMLAEIQVQYADNVPLVEHEISSLIERTYTDGPRGKRKSFLLLDMAIKQNLISELSANRLKERMNIPKVEKPDNTVQFPSNDNTMKEETQQYAKTEISPPVAVEKKEDIFDILRGPSQQ